MSKERFALPINKQIIDEAAEWFVEINEDEPDIATRQRFHAWLMLSPEHVRAYLKVLPIWEDGAHLDGEGNGDPQALVAWAREINNVVPLEAQRPDGGEPLQMRRELEAHEIRAVRPVLSRYVAIAASALLVILCTWFYIQRGTYATGIGEQRFITLADGSKIELNSRSRLKVRLTERERSIDLLEGQALFQVAKDGTRPFVVRSGNTWVRAVGTQFDVYRKAAGTIVTVVEGRVSIKQPSQFLFPMLEKKGATAHEVFLTAGEQLTVSPAVKPKAKRADVAVATAWTQQRLVFSKTPLTEVAEEFNRYNERRLIIESGGLKAFNISGTFSSTDPASLIRFLRAQSGVHVTEAGSEIRVSSD